MEISAESFVKLSNLVELDLSNNSLATVPSKAFAESTSLRRLSLAGNRIREIKSGAFLALGRLNHLDLSSNQLVHLETDAFRGLRSLQTLKLNRNQLQSLPAAESFVQFLPAKMAAIELHDNPWHCDCHLKPIREWLVANNIPVAIKPLCSAPVRLQGENHTFFSRQIVPSILHKRSNSEGFDIYSDAKHNEKGKMFEFKFRY